MTDQTPTPRTDGEDRWQVDKDELGLTCRETVRIDFARELERENAALRAALVELVAVEDLEIHAEQLRRDLSVPAEDFLAAEHDASVRKPLAWATARALVEQ